MTISSIFKNWYLQNKRDLPWRNSSEPYHVWVSEVILQQTRVAQGLPYYYRFIEAFPTIRALAEAPENILLKIWQGLGYYSRARNMQKGAQFILTNYNGCLPANYEQLLLINGIGEYTASAIASIAFNMPYPVVDGNVSRVISRMIGIFEPVNTASGKKLIMEYAGKFIDTDNPGIYNQAIMEFGALQCVPRNPDCQICPFKATCFAYKHNKINELPIKSKNLRMRKRYFYYLVISYTNNIYIHKRKTGDIWQGLFEFPLIETTEKISLEQLMKNEKLESLLPDGSFFVDGEPVYYSHQLTHQRIEACFIRIKAINPLLHLEGLYHKITPEDFADYPVSRLVNKYYEQHGLK
jgi:A/G-specific adenine glycosylase